MIQRHLGMLEGEGSLLDQVTGHWQCAILPSRIQRHLGRLEGEGTLLDQVAGQWSLYSVHSYW
jgi:hypothetical protein